MKTPLVSLRRVSVSYDGHDALKEVDLDIYPDDFLGIIGPNGGGKTTLVKAIVGTIPYRGTISYSPQLFRGKERLIGYMPQQSIFDRSFPISVLEVVMSGLQGQRGFHARYASGDRAKAQELLRTAGIDGIARKPIGEISGGQMQRVALASVLVLEPDILIIDEPTSQLDPQGTESVFEIIKMMKDKKKTIILVEHKIDLIAEYADEVLVLRGGKLIAGGDKAQVLSDISLMEQGVQLPQMAILGSRLKEKGFPISEIPVTEKRAVEIISAALNGRDTQ